jgi:alcohol dehydrogenase
MRRLLTLVQSGRFHPTPLIAHRFSLDEIAKGYQIFSERSDKVLKVAIKPSSTIFLGWLQPMSAFSSID